MRNPVPPLTTLGIAGAQASDQPAGIAELVDPSTNWLPARGQRLVFCEGFARDAGGNSYAWELWTHNEYQRVAESDPFDQAPSTPTPIATIAVGRHEGPTAEVVELVDDSGWTWTQILVPADTFGRDELEALLWSSDETRALVFSFIPDA